MDSRVYLQIAQNLIIKNYSAIIREIILENNRPVLKTVFYSGIVLYIRYNDFGEYTYLVIYSPNPDDQMRLDNYDNIWPVRTRPHHFHVRGMQSVVDSPMNGEPNRGVPLLFKNIQM